jgi:hypothetical protein
MTHCLPDEEFKEYQDTLQKVKELSEWKKEVEDRAVDYISRRAQFEQLSIRSDFWHGFTAPVACRYDVDGDYCDMCPLARIFPKCPTGRQKAFSK